MEVSEDLQKLFIGLINSANQIRKLVLFEVLAESSQAMLHEFVDFDRIVVFVMSMDGQADGADKSSVFAVGVNAYEGRILTV